MTTKQKKVLYRIIISFVLLVILSIVDKLVNLPAIVQLILYLVPYIVIGYDILKKAWKGILNKQVFDENFLMAVATIGALILGEYREAAAVMLFYQIGELFQSYAVGKSRKNISALMDIRPDYANLVAEDGSYEKVDPDDVEVGSIILINPGEKVPLDGVIVEGTTTLNTSALTGESVPRDAKVGEEIISGCINMTGMIKVETTKEFDESTVAKILDLVENSSMKKSRSENFITRFAKYYTPAVCYGALALAIIPSLLIILTGHIPEGGTWLTVFGEWIGRALTFLVISCPCALVISIPLSFFGGIGGASAKGILIKGSSYLEEMAKTKYVVFDKTGTLTKGVFEVTDIKPSENVDKDELIRLAAYVENYSNHPISKSLKAAYGKEVDTSIISDVEEIGGHGVSAKVDGKKISAGNEKLMKKLGIKFAEPDKVGTVVHVAIENDYAGYILISDVVKPDSKEAISVIKQAGVEKTVMLTGDAKRVADSVASEIGIDIVRSELLPQDKVSEVEKLLEEKNKKNEKDVLAFVGDGINDAPVLARADIGIAMGALGSDAAIEAADIVLMDDDPKKIALAMKISRKTVSIVKQNIVFAIGVKIICLVLGALGIANMWIAIFADVGVMVIAVLNAMRALRVKN